MSKPVQRRLRRSRQEITEILGAFDRSGQSAVAFARTERMALSTLHGWLWRRRKQRRASMQTALVPVHITAGDFTSTTAIELSLANGRLLRFAGDIVPKQLAAIVDALDRPCSR